MASAKDKDGRDLRQFLLDYDSSMYQKPSLTADSVIFKKDKQSLNVLLIQRAGHPCIGEWAFPGGFMNIDETLEDAASRELYEETSIKCKLCQLTTVSTVDRDLRCRIVTTVFFGFVDECKIQAGDDAQNACWFEVSMNVNDDICRLTLKREDLLFKPEIKLVTNAKGDIDINKSVIINSDNIAFDHAKILAFALKKVL